MLFLRHIRCLSLGLLLAWVLPLAAQPALSLRNGTFSLPANVKVGASPSWTDAALPDGHLRWLQFYQLPADDTRHRLSEAGVRWLSYVGSHTYEVAIPSDVPVALLLGAGVRSVHPVPAQAKTHPDLTSGFVPAHAQRGDRVEVMASLSPGLAAADLRAWLTAQGVTLLDLQPAQAPQVAIFQLPIDQVVTLAASPYLRYLEPVPPPSTPDDLPALSLHRANLINQRVGSGPRFDGSGVRVGIREWDRIGEHIDFQGRVNDMFTGNGTESHGNNSAGAALSAGNRSPRSVGMAPGAILYGVDYRPDFLGPTLPLHLSDSVVIFNTSFSNGCNQGYTTITEVVESQVYQHPTLTYVFSAGNSGTSDCGYGAGNGWGNVTGGHKMAKNAIVVGAVDGSDQLATFSSRGPAADGRLKPDLCGLGVSVSMPGLNNGVISASGTSFSAPGVAGICAQLYQAYRESHAGHDPSAALIKSLLLNGATDLGRSGPDFEYGWGRVHAGEALRALQNQWYLSGQVSQGQTQTHQISVPAEATAVRVMLYWADPPASPLAHRNLVNDLDIQGNGGSLLPLVLDHSPDPASLSSVAQPGRDSLNNVEQLIWENPSPGMMSIEVQGYSVPMGPQAYQLVYLIETDTPTVVFPNAGDQLLPGANNRLQWDAFGTAGSFDLSYSLDEGQSWQPIATGLGANTRAYQWLTPDTLTGRLRVRVSRSGVSDESDANSSIIRAPFDVQVEQVCPTQTVLSWEAIEGAEGYDVFVLGDRYMDSLAQTTDTSFTHLGTDVNQTYWYAVRARGPQAAISQRSPAVKRSPGRQNCPLDDDLAILGGGISPASQDWACDEVDLAAGFLVYNQGNTPLSNVQVSYRWGNGPWQRDTLLDPLAGGQAWEWHPITLPSMAESGTYWFEAAVFHPQDPLRSNDSLRSEVPLDLGQPQPLPYEQSFERMPICTTAPICHDAICPLAEGWTNATNLTDDGIDWRVNNGATPVASGPRRDARPGTPEGKYLYLEAGNGCNGFTAELVSPCLDLRESNRPELSFFWHSNGNGSFGGGRLSVDVWTQGRWVEIMPAIFGDQGSEWQKQVVSLEAYAGQVIRLRFRGETTLNNADAALALDHVVVKEAFQAMASFDAYPKLVCPGQGVNLLDFSLGDRGERQWLIAPEGARFEGGTDSSSALPLITFDDWGSYSVGLVIDALPMPDTLWQPGLIEVSPGLSPGLIADFEALTFPPKHWLRRDPGSDFGWELDQEVIGPEGHLTRAARLPRLPDGNLNELITPPLNLRGADQPRLVFAVSYALDNRRSGSERLRILADPACGQSFPDEIYDRAGSQLASYPALPESWEPKQSHHWRYDTVDLKAYAGSVIRLAWQGISGNNNPLFLDELRIIDVGNPRPAVNFTLSSSLLCRGESTTVSLAPGVEADSYQWDFGPGATPATASGAGPHVLRYASGGTKPISLTASNGAGSSTLQRAIAVWPTTDLDFVAEMIPTVDSLTYFFNNRSRGGSGGYRWYFGDGDSSESASPSHRFPARGLYEITLLAYSACAPDTLRRTLAVGIPAGVASPKPMNLRVRPNPSAGLFEIQVLGSQGGSLQWELWDAQGRRLRSGIASKPSGWTLDLGNVPAGVYQLRVQQGSRQAWQRLWRQ